MKRFTVILAFAVAALSVSGAFAQERSKSLRFGGYYVGPTGEFFEEVTGDDDDTQLFFEGDSTEAIFVSYEHFVGEQLGLEVSLSHYGLDVDGFAGISSRGAGEIFRGEFRATTDVTPISVGLNRHFGSSELLDFYIGAFVSYVLMDDLEFKRSEVVFQSTAPGVPVVENPFQAGDRLQVKDDLGWGALLGLDLRLGSAKKWFVTSALRYSRTAIELDGEGADNSEIDIDPWLFQLGFGVTF